MTAAGKALLSAARHLTGPGEGTPGTEGPLPGPVRRRISDRNTARHTHSAGSLFEDCHEVGLEPAIVSKSAGQAPCGQVPPRTAHDPF